MMKDFRLGHFIAIACSIARTSAFSLQPTRTSLSSYRPLIPPSIPNYNHRHNIIETLPPSRSIPLCHVLRIRTNQRTPPIVATTSLLMASPSGIDELPIILQTSTFIGIFALLGVTTSASIAAIDSFSKSILGLEKWRNAFVDTSLPIVLGAFYLFAGMGHFISRDAFCDIYPPIGTWGIWYLPGSAEFHVAWTGVVEVLGGGGLLFGGLRSSLGMTDDDDDDDDNWILKIIQPMSAAALFLLTLLVTPANIYMYTHGATMGDNMGALDVSFHYFRFGFQVLFLSLLFVVSKDSFFFAWGDELD